MKKINRIRKSQEFQTIIRKRKSLANSSFVIYFQPKTKTKARFGISVSKKLGKAVQRNLYKRQCRMMVQEIVDFEKANCDTVIIVRSSYLDKAYADNRNNLENLLKKGKII